MALVKSISNSTHVMRDYKIAHTWTRENALLWIALVSKKPEIRVKRIEVDDFLSFDDGSISKQIHQIAEIDKFVNLYKDSSIESVSIVGEYIEKPFVLSVGLDSGIIGLSCRKSKMVDYQSLEQLLELV